MGAGVLVAFILAAFATAMIVWYLVEVRRVGRPAPAPVWTITPYGYAVDEQGRAWRDGD